MDYVGKTFISTVLLFVFPITAVFAQIPMERVLARITIPAQGDLRGLVDTVGFAHRAEQMDRLVPRAEQMEKENLLANQRKTGWSEDTALIYGICPHDDYMLAGRTYVHIQRFIKAHTVILIGNAHWAETFGIRNKLIFGDFKRWRGPYGPVKVSQMREKVQRKLPADSYTVNRTLAATEHSLEALVPFLQYYNRNVQIVPIFVPYTEWNEENRLAEALAAAIAILLREHNWQLGKDIAILCSTDGQHYGDYGWSYYDFHPFGCTPDGYRKAMALDQDLVTSYLTGDITVEKLHHLFGRLINEQNISEYKITWCGRFSVTLATNFALRLVEKVENRRLKGHFLRHSSSIHEQWLSVWDLGLGITGDTNLHHFVTYVAVGFN